MTQSALVIVIDHLFEVDVNLLAATVHTVELVAAVVDGILAYGAEVVDPGPLQHALKVHEVPAMGLDIHTSLLANNTHPHRIVLLINLLPSAKIRNTILVHGKLHHLFLSLEPMSRVFIAAVKGKAGRDQQKQSHHNGGCLGFKWLSLVGEA